MEARDDLVVTEFFFQVSLSHIITIRVWQLFIEKLNMFFFKSISTITQNKPRNMFKSPHRYLLNWAHMIIKKKISCCDIESDRVKN